MCTCHAIQGHPWNILEHLACASMTDITFLVENGLLPALWVNALGCIRLSNCYFSITCIHHLLYNMYLNAHTHMYLQRDSLSKCHIPRHSQVVKIQHVRNTVKSVQKLPHLCKTKEGNNTSLKIVLFTTTNLGEVRITQLDQRKSRIVTCGVGG